MTVLAQSKYKVQNEVNSGGFVACATATVAVYENPDTDSSVIGQIVKNQTIRATGDEGDYYSVSVGNRKGWVLSKYFLFGNELLEYIQNNTAWFPRILRVTDESNYFSMETDSVTGTVKVGEEYQIYREDEAYYVVIRSVLDEDSNEVNTLITIPKTAGYVTYRIPVVALEDTEFSSEVANLVEYACSFVGCQYVWGGTNPETGVDCSGFVRYVYKHFGYDLPRVSADQANFGTRVSFDELKPGDLIFYYRGNKIGHVTMYVGDGMCVHARGTAYGVCITRYDYSKPAWAMRVIE